MNIKKENYVTAGVKRESNKKEKPRFRQHKMNTTNTIMSNKKMTVKKDLTLFNSLSTFKVFALLTG